MWFPDETVKIDNIEFSFFNQGHDAAQDEENLGLAMMSIPGPMLNRFIRDVGAEGILPHYDEYQMQDVNRKSDHDCDNADTQIVLMNYLFSKRRNYKLDYYGLDPFWLFHDSFHAKNDVYGGYVDGINSHVEIERLLQGAEFAHSKGFGIKPETLAKLHRDWANRWNWRETGTYAKFKLTDFFKFMPPQDVDVLDYMISCGIYTPLNYEDISDALQED